MKIQLVIVDDDQGFARELKSALADFPEIDSITLFSSGFSFVHQLSSMKEIPDVVLMDISMSTPDEGIKATGMLHEKFPSTKVVMFTVSEDDEHIFEAFKSGAVGYLLKNERPAFIYKTILDVFKGGALMSPGVAMKTIRYFSNQAKPNAAQPASNIVSEREMEVLNLVAKGFPYKMIADQLFLSPDTVKKHMANIFRKLQVRNKVEALNKIRNGG